MNERCEEREVPKAEARARKILHGLGFDPPKQDALTHTFSGTHSRDQRHSQRPSQIKSDRMQSYHFLEYSEPNVATPSSHFNDTRHGKGGK